MALYFYPRPPRGGRPDDPVVSARRDGFLSTPSARRATLRMPWGLTFRQYFYPRPPRGGRRANSMRRAWRHDFYPRPPRGGRLLRACNEMDAFEFLSTPSARRATPKGSHRKEETGDFYPRPPRGGRPREPNRKGVSTIFLSTPSARRATSICALLVLP